MTEQVDVAVLDAANIAARNQHGRPVDWHFGRVERVRELCRQLWPGVHVRGMLDASVDHLVTDRAELRAALLDGWLEIAPGDADDLVLQYADDTGGIVISRDHFRDARRNYPWLDEEPGRVWMQYWRSGKVFIKPHHLKPISDEDVARARRAKERKAGFLSMADGEVWICRAPPGRCRYAGLPTTPQGSGTHRFCARCGEVAEERLYEPPEPAGPPALLLTVDGVDRGLIGLADSLVIGRGGPSRPDVTDVTEGLGRDDASKIGRRHLAVEVDDDGWPVVIHQSRDGHSFINPSFGADGRPADNRLQTGARYPLGEDDELVLGSGRIRITVVREMR